MPPLPSSASFESSTGRLLGTHNTRVVCRFRKRGIGAVVQETISPAAIADEEEGCQENQGTNCARFPLQEEAEQVEAHEHGVAEPQGGVEGLGDEEDRQQPLEAIHDLCQAGPSPRPLGTAAGTNLMRASGRGRLPSAFFHPHSPGAEPLCSLAVSLGSPKQQGS